MKTGSTAYYKETLKETVMANYSKSKATPLASTHAYFETEIKNSPALQPDEKEIHLQNLQKAYEQTWDEIFRMPED